MTVAIVFTVAIVLLYVLAVRAEFFHKSPLYPEHAHPLHYWWNRLIHHKR